MNKVVLEKLLREEMARRGWSWQRRCSLSPAFVTCAEITPLFIPNFIRKPKGDYVIDGYVGLLHGKFEEYWMQRCGAQQPSGRNTFCFIRNIANISQLLHSSYIHASDPENEVELFCVALTQFLDVMPQSSDALKLVFTTNALLGTSLGNYIAYNREEKFSEFRAFVLAD